MNVNMTPGSMFPAYSMTIAMPTPIHPRQYVSKSQLQIGQQLRSMANTQGFNLSSQLEPHYVDSHSALHQSHSTLHQSPILQQHRPFNYCGNPQILLFSGYPLLDNTIGMPTDYNPSRNVQDKTNVCTAGTGMLVGDNTNKSIVATASARNQTDSPRKNKPEIVTTSSNSMPTTTITTTTAYMNTTTQGGNLSHTTTSVVMSTCKVVTEDQPMKRKQPEDPEGDNVHKKPNLAEGETLMERMYNELIGMKDMMGALTTKVESIQEETKDWKIQLTELNRDITDVKESINMAHNMIEDEKERVRNEKSVQDSLAEHKKEISSNVRLLKSHGKDINILKDDLKKVCKEVNVVVENNRKQKAPLAALSTKIESMVGAIEYPVKHTVVGQRVRFNENEDIMEVAKKLVNDALGLSDVSVVRAVRKSGWNSKDKLGLIKIELENSDAMKMVLRNKKKLKDHPESDYQKIFLRQSKPEQGLTMERNEDLILREMGVHDDYVRLAMGHLVHKDHGKYK